MIKSLIIDDLADVRETLNIMLTEFCGDQITVIGEADGVKSGIEKIEKLKPQLVFLDINLGIGTGFDILSRFPQPAPFEVIFVTDYQEFAVRAFEVAAVGFVPKPISIELLQKYVGRAVERISLNETGKSTKILLENHQKRDQEQTLSIPLSGGKLRFIRIADIIYCQAMAKESVIITAQKERITTTRGVGKLGELLDAFGFHLIHGSFLVNEKHIHEYDKDDQKVRMSNGQKLDVSDRKRNDFLKKFLKPQ
jgi:two-component system, LytTR family, response regulator